MNAQRRHPRSGSVSDFIDDGSEVGKGRLETLTDGVFAISMTLLVLGLHVTNLSSELSVHGPTVALLGQWPNLAAYALSFAILGQYWVSTHNQFRFMRRADHWLLWLNIIYLFFISLVAFSADLLGRFGPGEPVVVVYGLNFFPLSAIQLGMWAWATRERHLVDVDLPDSTIRQGFVLPLIGVVGYGLAALIGPFAPFAAGVLFVLIPILNISTLGHRFVARVWA